MPARILLVEDDLDAAGLLSLVLQTEGFEVAVAADALEALGLLKWFQPSAVLIDIGLPVIDGYELARRAREIWPCTLIAVSASEPPLDDVKRRCFDAYFVKPVDFGALRAAIERLSGNPDSRAVRANSEGDSE